jgi:uncharacterized peroxidase-related enzyme
MQVEVLFSILYTPSHLSNRLLASTHWGSKILTAMLLQTIDSRLRMLPLHCVRAIRVVSPGAPVDILKAFMYRPDSFGRPFCALAHTLMRGRSDWSEGDREVLGAFVSDLNRCTHCATAHCEVASLIVGRARTRDVPQKNTDPGCEAKLHAFQDFATKVTLSPESIKSNDAVALQTAKLTDNAIVDGMLIVAGFNLINRVASALHFKVPSSSEMLPSAWFLRIFGYRFLSGLPLRATRSSGAIEITDRNGITRGDRATLVASTRKWLKMLAGLDCDALDRAPEVARDVIRKIEREPDTVSERDVAGLKSCGCSEDEIFNLIVAAAATSALVRLEVGLRAARLQLSPRTRELLQRSD